jgi:hypothetical protein
MLPVGVPEPIKVGLADSAWKPRRTPPKVGFCIFSTWKTWRTHLENVSYWDKTISLNIYERITAD